MSYLQMNLQQQRRTHPLNIYADSPLATEATAATIKHWRLLDLDAVALPESPMKAAQL